MPKDNHENSRGAPAASAEAARRVEQDFQGVTIIVRALGWTDPPAHGLRVSVREVTTPIGEIDFKWDRWDIPELRLSKQASLLLAQGMSPQKIFDHCRFECKQNDTSYAGRIFYLRGNYDRSNPIPQLSNVVVGCPQGYQSIRSDERILQALVEEVLKS